MKVSRIRLVLHQAGGHELVLGSFNPSMEGFSQNGPLDHKSLRLDRRATEVRSLGSLSAVRSGEHGLDYAVERADGTIGLVSDLAGWLRGDCDPTVL